MLPQANSASRLDDLVENAIFISEDGNGIFDNNDYILFYGESPHTWTYNTTSDTYTHALNLYSDQNFYFLTYGQQTGKRIASQASIGGTAQTLSEFDEHLFSETDIYNILDSGREWYGFQFSPYNPSSTTTLMITSSFMRQFWKTVGIPVTKSHRSRLMPRWMTSCCRRTASTTPSASISAV